MASYQGESCKTGMHSEYSVLDLVDKCSPNLTEFLYLLVL
jgi:hypothetical protein